MRRLDFEIDIVLSRDTRAILSPFYIRRTAVRKKIDMALAEVRPTFESRTILGNNDT